MGLRRSALVSLVASLAFALPAAPSFAQSCQAPPGSSAVDQYCEAIPGAEGDEPTAQRNGNGTAAAGGNGNSGGGGGSGPAVSSQAAAALAARGSDGDAVLQLSGGKADAAGRDAGASAGSATDGTASGAVTGSSGGASAADDLGPAAAAPPSSNPLRAVSSAVQAGDTVGTGLVWFLLGAAVAIFGFGYVGTRRRGGGTPA